MVCIHAQVLGIAANGWHIRYRVAYLACAYTAAQRVDDTHPVVARGKGRLFFHIHILSLAHDGVCKPGTGRQNFHPHLPWAGLRECVLRHQVQIFRPAKCAELNALPLCCGHACLSLIE